MPKNVQEVYAFATERLCFFLLTQQSVPHLLKRIEGQLKQSKHLKVQTLNHSNIIQFKHLTIQKLNNSNN
jgi:hypothetical protein